MRRGRGRGGTQGEGFAGGGGGGGGPGSCGRHCLLTVGGRGARAERRAGAVYTNVLIVSKDIGSVFFLRK
jgi:hypothetical protein